MSGVTVATMIRSISLGVDAGLLERVRAGGSARSDIASSGAAIRRSRMPVRSMIHSSEVSTSSGELVVRDHAVGHVAAEPGDRIRGRPFVVPITLASRTAKVSVPRTASSPSTVARALPRPTGPRTLSSSHSSCSSSPGPHDPLEAHVVDAGEERELAAVLLLGEHGDGAGLRQRLDHQHAGHDRVAREVAGAVRPRSRACARRRARRARARAPRRASRNGSRWGRIASISLASERRLHHATACSTASSRARSRARARWA